MRLAATFGLAQAHEALSEVDEAISLYEQVQTSPTALGREAARRLEALSEGDVKRFYMWFANNRPQPALPPMSSTPDFLQT